MPIILKKKKQEDAVELLFHTWPSPSSHGLLPQWGGSRVCPFMTVRINDVSAPPLQLPGGKKNNNTGACVGLQTVTHHHYPLRFNELNRWERRLLRVCVSNTADEKQTPPVPTVPLPRAIQIPEKACLCTSLCFWGRMIRHERGVEVESRGWSLCRLYGSSPVKAQPWFNREKRTAGSREPWNKYNE